jgi:hypothetical protein
MAGLKLIKVQAREAEVECGGRMPVDLGELVFGSGEAEFQPFDLAEPAFTFGR